MIITVFAWRYILRVKANIKIWYLVICQFLQWICCEIAPNFRYPQGTEVLQFCIFYNSTHYSTTIDTTDDTSYTMLRCYIPHRIIS